MATEKFPSSPTGAAPRRLPPHGAGVLVKGLLPLLVFAAFAAAWKWTPLQTHCELDNLARLAAGLRENPFAVPIVIGVYVVGGLVMFPLMALVLATIFTFDPLTAFGISLAGCLANAVALFAVGYGLGRETVRRLAGKRFDRLSARLERQGFLVVTTLRLFPIAPYTIVNFVAGAADIRFRDYVLGTVLGLVPWLALICSLSEPIARAVRHPTPLSTGLFALLVVVVYVANYTANRWLAKKDAQAASSA